MYVKYMGAYYLITFLVVFFFWLDRKKAKKPKPKKTKKPSVSVAYAHDIRIYKRGNKIKKLRRL